MIVQKTWPQYVAIRIVIILMRDLGLLCLAYFFIVLAIFGVPGIANPFSIFVEVVGLIEILFYLGFFLPYRWFLQSWQPYQPQPLSREQRALLFYKSLSLVPEIDTFLRKWMNNVAREDVRRDNVSDWLAWALWEKDSIKENRDPMMKVEIDRYINDMEETFGMALKSGRGEGEAIRLPIDPVIIQNRSLAYYMVIGLMDHIMMGYLLATGWKYHRPPLSAFFKVFPLRFINLATPLFEPSDEPGMSFWYRPHKSKTHRPILFIHGLGIGLIPYMFWFRTLPKDVGVLAVEMLPIATRVTAYPQPSTPQLCEMISRCVTQIRSMEPRGTWDEFVLIGNSYGTLLMKPLLQRPEIAQRVAANVLIDPIPLLLHLPDVAYNFTRRVPRKSVRGKPGHGNEWEIWWASGTDAGTAHTLARRFCWRECLMWREDLTPSMNPDITLCRPGLRSTVVLGGEDCVTCPKEVASYVYSGNVHWADDDKETWKNYQWMGDQELELLLLDGKDHGQGIMVPIPDKRIRPVIENYCRRDIRFISSPVKENIGHTMETVAKARYTSASIRSGEQDEVGWKQESDYVVSELPAVRLNHTSQAGRSYGR